MSLPKKIELTQELQSTLKEARLNVSLGSYIASYMLSHTNIFFVEELPKYNTAAAYTNIKTGELHIAICKDFWLGLPNIKQRAFVLVHEVEHMFLRHAYRQRDMGYNAELWNCAADYYINYTGMGYRGGVQDPRTAKYIEVPDWVLFEKKFEGMSADDIYDYLKKNGQGQGDNGFDDTGTIIEFGDGDSSSGAVEQKIREVLSGAVAFAKSAGKAMGDGYAQFINDLEDMTEVRVDWHDLLSVTTTCSSVQNTNYKKPNRRGDGSVIYPSYDGESVSLVFGFDSSGSMSQEDYAEVAGALYGILEQFEEWTIRVVSCDTRYNLIGEFSSEDGYDFSNIDLKAIGGGGTCMKPIADFTKSQIENGEEIDGMIIVTDGYIPTEPLMDSLSNEINNVVVVTRSGNKNLQLTGCELIHVK